MAGRHLRALTAVALVLGAFTASSPACAQARFSPKKAIWGPVTLNGHSAFPLYSRLGVGIYETSLNWSQVAQTRPTHALDPRDPAYHWPAETDAAVRQAARFHIRVMLQLITAPPWSNGGKPDNWAPKRASDFAEFAAAAALRYPNVHLWMVWGEPSRDVTFNPLQHAPRGRPLTPGQAAAPRRYARMLDAAYGQLKRVSSRNLVIGGNTYTSGDISTAQWITNMRLPNGSPPRMDLYGHNPFSAREPNFANPPSPAQAVDFSDLQRLHRLVDRRLGRPRGRTLRLFLSEWTIPTAADREFGFYVELNTQKQWITKAFSIVNSSPFIYALGWINLYDDPPRSGGGLFFADGRPKPGYYAFARG